MAGEGGDGEALKLDGTPTWIVAAVCSVIVCISLFFERFLHRLGKGTIQRICIPESYTRHLRPCKSEDLDGDKVTAHYRSDFIAGVFGSGRRLFAEGGADGQHCARQASLLLFPHFFCEVQIDSNGRTWLSGEVVVLQCGYRRGCGLKTACGLGGNGSYRCLECWVVRALLGSLWRAAGGGRLLETGAWKIVLCGEVLCDSVGKERMLEGRCRLRGNWTWWL
ncbi:hypothetical protein KSP40_PGU001506 [Platanthera guangdongensis]|uniref:Uncharacterized protein n=1 Tax=Platanthera guangdongensis TaxID=2320717 RepID=A0ABR2M2S8_9ASPA